MQYIPSMMCTVRTPSIRCRFGAVELHRGMTYQALPRIPGGLKQVPQGSVLAGLLGEACSYAAIVSTNSTKSTVSSLGCSEVGQLLSVHIGYTAGCP